MASKHWKRGLAVISATSALGLLLIGCGTGSSKSNSSSSSSNQASQSNTAASSNTSSGGSSTSSSGPIEGGSILLDTTSNFKDLDPALSYDTTSDEAVSQMYDQLVTYKGATTDITPMLAESYTVSPDGKTYTFKIRQGVTFWNGDKLTAQSFIDEFERVLGKGGVNSPGESFIDPIVVGSTAYNKLKDKTGKTISGITAPDPYTLVIKLTKPEPFFLQILAMPFFSAVDQSFITKVGNKAFDANQAMGTGPFELGSIDANQLVLKKNPNYWLKDSQGNQLPYLDKVTMRINKNGQLDALNFENGQTALMGNLIGIPSSSYPHFKTDPTLSKDLVTNPENAVFYIGMNNKAKYFSNVKVRQAVEYAINKKKLIQLINGRGQVANQPLPPGIKGYMQNLPADASYSYDPTKAKQLLAAAGYPNGFSTTFYSSNDPDQIKMDQSIQADLAAIGIKATIKDEDWNTYLDQNEKGKTPIFALGWFQDFPDASDFLNTLFNTNEQPANNSTLYSNKQVDSWLNKAQTDTNQAERISLYNKVTEQVMKDAAWVPEYYPTAVYAVQPWVHGYFYSPVLMDPLQRMWIDKGHSQG